MGKFEKLSLQEMIDTREHTIKEMRSLNDGCTGEDGTVREFTGDEEVKYRAMGDDVKDLTALISKCKRENELKGFTSDLPLPQPQQENRGDRRMEEFREFLRDGKVEKRDTLVIDGSGASAAVLAPEELVKQILMPARSDLTLLGKVYTVHLNKAASLGVPYESADASDASWTTEVPASLTADATLAYNKRELGANMLIKLITVSDKTLQTNAFNVESLIADKLSYKMRRPCAWEPEADSPSAFSWRTQAESPRRLTSLPRTRTSSRATTSSRRSAPSRASTAQGAHGSSTPTWLRTFSFSRTRTTSISGAQASPRTTRTSLTDPPSSRASGLPTP